MSVHLIEFSFTSQADHGGSVLREMIAFHASLYAHPLRLRLGTASPSILLPLHAPSLALAAPQRVALQKFNCAVVLAGGRQALAAAVGVRRVGQGEGEAEKGESPAEP